MSGTVCVEARELATLDDGTPAPAETGSWLFGRLIVADFARRGFDVTVVNRGRRTPSLPDGVQHVVADRRSEDDLRALARAGPWDTGIDISGKVPAVIRRTVRVLATPSDSTCPFPR